MSENACSQCGCIGFHSLRCAYIQPNAIEKQDYEAQIAILQSRLEKLERVREAAQLILRAVVDGKIKLMPLDQLTHALAALEDDDD